MAAEGTSKSGTSEYYDAWERYTKAVAGDGEDEDDEVNASKDVTFPTVNSASSAFSSGVGYDFRKGKKTRFPEIVNAEGETDEAAAFRVAGERRAAGLTSFADGGVWGAQEAVDAWGQGLLALERLKNLRRRRRAELEVAAEADGAEADGAPAPVDTEEPSDEEVRSLLLTLRLNIAQALLKLRDFEHCVLHCDMALEVDPQNTKALWRKAKAVWGIRNPGLAREALERLLAVDEGNPAAVAMLREIEAEEARKKLRRHGAPAPKQPARPAPKAAAAVAPAAPAEPAAPAPAAEAASEGGTAWERCCCRRRKDKSL